jgi:hypothetical protein
MSEIITKMPISIFLWLITLSFSCGVLFMQVQSQKEMIEKQITISNQVYYDLRAIQSDLAELRGYLKAREQK